MRCTIYIDRLFGINFLLNFFLLLCVSLLIRKKIVWWRLLTGTTIGTLGYCCFLLLRIEPCKMVVGGVGCLLLGGVIARICFGMGREYFVKGLCLLYSGVLLLGGLLSFLRRYFYRKSEKQMVRTLAAGMFISYVGVVMVRVYSRRKKKKIFPVRILVGGNKYEMRGLVDSGNHLREPVTGKPVCVLDSVVAERIREQIHEKDFLQIPFRTVGEREEIMEAIETDGIVIDAGNKQIIPGVILAFGRQNYAKREQFEILLHPDILEV